MPLLVIFALFLLKMLYDIVSSCEISQSASGLLQNVLAQNNLFEINFFKHALFDNKCLLNKNHALRARSR